MQDLGSVSVWNLESGSLISLCGLWMKSFRHVRSALHEVKSGERVSL